MTAALTRRHALVGRAPIIVPVTETFRSLITITGMLSSACMALLSTSRLGWHDSAAEDGR